MWQDKKTLVTGGAGFIGSNLAIRLVAEGARVTVLDAMLPNCGGNFYNLEPIRSAIQFTIADMRDEHGLASLVKEQEVIFNLAGLNSHGDSMKYPQADMQGNVWAQLCLLESCRHHNPHATVVFTSTRQVYGPPRYVPVDEGHPTNPSDINGIHKLAGEQYHRLYARVYGLRTVVLRLTNTYGPRQPIKDDRHGFIGWLASRAILGEAIYLFGDGEQVRDFTYVDDVAEALMLAATCPSCAGGIYNLSGERATLRKVADTLAALCPKRSRVETVPFPTERQKIDIGNYYGTAEAFSRETGWQPRIGLEQGLSRMVEYISGNLDYYMQRL